VATFASLGLHNSAMAQSIVYDNSAAANYLGKQVNGTQLPVGTTEFGDEIKLAGTDRSLTDFKVEIFAALTAVGGETATLRLYANTGPDFAPGAPTPAATALYTSGPISLVNGVQTLSAPGIAGTVVPGDLTWTIEVTGLGVGETAGLNLYNPPTVGSSFSDFWVKSGGAWSLNTLDSGATPANFGAQVTAVPEASSVAYAMVGGLFFIGFHGYRRWAAKRV
jgi:hypothetical protein